MAEDRAGPPGRRRDLARRIGIMQAACLAYWRALPAGYDEQDHADAMELWDEAHGYWLEAARDEYENRRRG